MARDAKTAAVAELAERFREADGALLTEYRGLTVKQLKELRFALGASASYAVVKNTLTMRAAGDAGVEGLDSLLVGPSAIAFVKGDVVEAAKGLRDFAKANPALVIKGGVVDGRPVTPEDVARLADLDSRDVLLAKLAGAMSASMSGAAALFAAPVMQLARLIAALHDARTASTPPAPAAAEQDAAQDAAQARPAPDPVPAAASPGPATEDVTTPTGADVVADPQD